MQVTVDAKRLGSEAKRIATALYRRVNRSSTAGLTWKRQGDNITFKWNGFVSAPSIAMLFARHHHEVTLIRRLVGDEPVARSLEFGCGFGRLSPTFAALSAHHTAIDINAEALDAAGSAYPDIDFQHVSGQGLPFADNTFDLVVSWTVVQHVPPHLIDGVLGDIMRVLKPDGRLLLCEETRLAGRQDGGARLHSWHRDPEFYEKSFAPLRMTYSSFIEEIDRLPSLVSPGRVMLFEP